MSIVHAESADKCRSVTFVILLQMQYSKLEGGVPPRYDEGEDMVRQLQANQTGVDDRLRQAQIQLFKNRQLIGAGTELDPISEKAEGKGELDSEGAESDESESDSEEDEDAEEDESSDEEEEDQDSEEEEEGAAPSFKGMPQEQIEVEPCVLDLLDAAIMHCRLTLFIKRHLFHRYVLCLQVLAQIYSIYTLH